MNVILFFTYGVSLKTWESSGLLSREMKFYEEMSKKYNIKYTFVTYGDSEDNSFNNYFENLKIIPIYEHIKYSNYKYLRLIKSLLFPFKIKNKINKETSIIKTNQLYGAWVAIIFKLITGSPLIVRTGYDLYTFSKKDRKNIIKQYFYYLLTLISLNYSDLYFSSSSYDIEFLINKFKFKREKIIHIPNWVQVEKNYNQKRNENKILMVGRLEPQKRFDEAIEVLKGSDYILEIYGDGSLEKDLKNMSKGFNNINFLGRISNDELLKKYSEYKIYLSLSEYEGNSKTILEAMGSGCVSVVSDIPNNKEIIKNNLNGIIFNKEKDNLLNIISQLFQNETTLQEISKNGIQYINENNSLKLIADKEFTNYSKLN